MHRLRNKVLLFVPTAAAALAALGLHRYMMENCIAHMGLLIPGNLPRKLLWVLGIGFPGYLLILLSTLGGRGSYGDNFPRSIFNGGLMLAAECAADVPLENIEAICCTLERMQDYKG